MKKILSLITAISILLLSLLAFVSCAEPDNTQLRVGYMTGPTGIGMAKLINDNGGAAEGNEKYYFEKFADTSLASAALLSNKLDAVCLPTNEAAKHFNENEGELTVLAINCLSSLFLLTDSSTDIESFEDLNGKTIYTCKNGTPNLVIKYLLQEAGVNATVSHEINGKTIVKPADLSPLLINGEIDIAVVPEPLITAALLNIASSGSENTYSIDLALGEVWEELTNAPLVMGCIVARTDFVEAHPQVISSFLDEYRASIEYVSNEKNLDTAAQYTVDAGIMAAVPAAKKAIKNLGASIAYLDGDDMKTALIAFYNAIGTTAIGGKLPNEEFYYSK